MIQHPQRGRIPFSLYPFQEKVLQLFQENPYSNCTQISPVGYFNIGCWLFFVVNVIPQG